MTATIKKTHRGGRPPKFAEKTTPVTMRLPLSTLERLSRIDSDRTRAVVRAVAAADADKNDDTGVQALAISSGKALITVSACPHLRDIPWLRLIEISPGRNLLSLRKGIPIEKLEVTLGDILDGDDAPAENERRTISNLLECIRTPRRNRTVETEEILLVGIHSQKAAPRRAKPRFDETKTKEPAK